MRNATCAAFSCRHNRHEPVDITTVEAAKQQKQQRNVFKRQTTGAALTSPERPNSIRPNFWPCPTFSNTPLPCEKTTITQPRHTDTFERPQEYYVFCFFVCVVLLFFVTALMSACNIFATRCRRASPKRDMIRLASETRMLTLFVWQCVSMTRNLSVHFYRAPASAKQATSRRICARDFAT